MVLAGTRIKVKTDTANKNGERTEPSLMPRLILNITPRKNYTIYRSLNAQQFTILSQER